MGKKRGLVRAERAKSSHAYGVYGEMTEHAIDLVKAGTPPDLAWTQAGIAKYGREGVSESQTKVCPRETFLALCEIWESAEADRIHLAGLRGKNAKHAAETFRQLQLHTEWADQIPARLWVLMQSVCDLPKSGTNGHMAILLTFWHFVFSEDDRSGRR